MNEINEMKAIITVERNVIGTALHATTTSNNNVTQQVVEEKQ
jgi:hypothetical protein